MQILLLSIIGVLSAYILFREWQFAKKINFYQLFVDEMPFEVVAYDKNLKFRLICGEAVKNPEMRRWLIGRTEHDYWVNRRNNIFIAEHRTKLIKSVVDTREMASFEERIIDRNGHEKIYTRRYKPVFDKNGDLLMILGSGYDLTEERKREVELEYLNNELQRSNEDLANFAHVASHDLKTPLRGIVSFLQLLERKNRDRFDETDHEYLSFALNSGKQMNKLIDALLNYSQINKNLEEPRIINLNKTVELISLNLKQQQQFKNIEIKTNPLPHVKAHDFQMTQLFQNLIENGLKYNKSEQPIIQIDAHQEGNDIIFSVRDNGIGISPEYWERIFKVFHRLHGVEQFEGTGIGLAACKRIVDCFGGKIWLDSTPGEGTTFFFTLPAVA